jgi:hypothetical protein
VHATLSPSSSLSLTGEKGAKERERERGRERNWEVEREIVRETEGGRERE